MRRIDELGDLNSCLNKARDNEMTFILLGRDLVAPSVIRFWVRERIISGCNKGGDPQLREALEVANTMEKERKKFRKVLRQAQRRKEKKNDETHSI